MSASDEPSFGSRIRLLFRKEHGMIPEQQIDHLIRAGWEVLQTDFDETAFENWRRQACQCLTALLGEDHQYTRQLQSKILKPERRGLLTGVGVLTAAALKPSNKD